jgi:hypothetical protein
MRVQGPQAPGSYLGLGPAQVGGAEKHLALQVTFLHAVVIHDPERADPGGGQVQQQRRAQTAGPDDEHAGAFEFLLARQAELRDDHMPAVPRPFGRGERGQQRIFLVLSGHHPYKQKLKQNKKSLSGYEKAFPYLLSVNKY